MDVVDTAEDTLDLEGKKASNFATSRLKHCSSHKKNDQTDIATNVLEAELDIQRQLLETIKLVEANQKEQVEMTRKIYRSLDKMYEQNKKHFQQIESLKCQEIDEMRRHNAFMEKLRVREVEYKLEKNRIQMQMQEYAN